MTEPEHFCAPVAEGVSLDAMLRLATQSRQGLFIWDTNLCLSGYNARICEILGMDTQDFRLGETYSEIICRIENAGRETRPGMVWPARLPIRDFSHARELVRSETDTLTTLPGRNDVGIKVQRMIIDDRWMLSILSDIRDLEEANRESERKKVYLDVTFENMIDGVMLVDRNGFVDACNMSMLKMHGMDPARYWSGMAFDDFIALNRGFDSLTTEQRAGVIKISHELVDGRAFTRGKHTRRIEHLTGRVFEYSRRELPNQSVVLTVRDVSEGHQLEQQRLYFETILETISDGAMMLDQQNRVVACNKRFLEHYGVDPLAYEQGMPVTEFAKLHGDLALAAPHERNRIVRERSEFGSGLRAQDSVETTERRMLNGEILRVTRNALSNGCAVITVRNTTQAVQLARQRQMFKTVIDNISDGVTLIDASGHFAVMNDRMLQLHEVDPDEVAGKTDVESFARACGDLDDLTQEEAAKEVASRIAFATDQTPGTSNRIQDLGNGRKLHIVRRVLDDGSAVATYRDVTQETRTRDLLEQAKMSAEEANRLKSDFLAKVTHDLRTPMHGVLGMAELLRTTGLNADQENMLDMLSLSGEHMVELIDGLLTLSTLESGQVELKSEPTDLRELIGNCVEIMSAQTHEKGLDLNVKAPLHGGSLVLGDGTRIMQVLLNLLGNAVKFTDAGSVSLIATSVRKGDSLGVSISVRDTGPGIPAGKLQEVFEKFQQLDHPTPRKHKGVGLGLSIARSLVEQMGGRLTVDSKPGQGAEFKMRLILPTPEEELASLSA